MAEVNVELLEKTMQHIKDHPEEHDQYEIWSCGTPGCFVGWAMHFSGLTYEDWRKEISDIAWAAENFGITWKEAACIYDENNIAWAAENFGITWKEAACIYDENNTIPMLELMVKDAINGETIKMPQHYKKVLGLSVDDLED